MGYAKAAGDGWAVGEIRAGPRPSARRHHDDVMAAAYRTIREAAAPGGGIDVSRSRAREVLLRIRHWCEQRLDERTTEG